MGPRHYWYFGLTLAFILLPSLTMTGFSFRWYLMDADNADLERVPLWKWILRLVVLMLQVSELWEILILCVSDEVETIKIVQFAKVSNYDCCAVYSPRTVLDGTQADRADIFPQDPSTSRDILSQN